MSRRDGGVGGGGGDGGWEVRGRASVRNGAGEESLKRHSLMDGTLHSKLKKGLDDYLKIL